MHDLKQFGMILGSMVFAASLFAFPLQAAAQDKLPDLDGTTYGMMLQDLTGQLAKLESTDASEREEALHETTLTLAEQSLVMVRMIDALHDKVNGLIEEREELVNAGETKFSDIGATYREYRSPDVRRRVMSR